MGFSMEHHYWGQEPLWGSWGFIPGKQLAFFPSEGLAFPERPPVSWAASLPHTESSQREELRSDHPRRSQPFHNRGSWGPERKGLAHGHSTIRGKRDWDLGSWSQIQCSPSPSTVLSPHLDFVGSVVLSPLQSSVITYIIFLTTWKMGARVLLSPSEVEETETQAQEGHMANPRQRWDRNSDSRIPASSCSLLLPWPLKTHGHMSPSLEGSVSYPDPPCQKPLLCSAGEGWSTRYWRKANARSLSIWKGDTQQVLSQRPGTVGGAKPKASKAWLNPRRKPLMSWVTPCILLSLSELPICAAGIPDLTWQGCWKEWA